MPRLKEIRMPGLGGMNLDTDDKLISKESSRETFNLRSFVTDQGKKGLKEKFTGNSIVWYPYLYTDAYKCVGTVEDHRNNAILYFLCAISSNDSMPNTNHVHKILRYLVNENTVELIMQHDILNFQPNSYIRANIIDDLLYWTDGYDNGFGYTEYNPPRKINVKKAYNWANNVLCAALDRYFPNNEQTNELVFNLLDAIKHPPKFGPTLLNGVININGVNFTFVDGYSNDENYDFNALRGKLFQFRTRFYYDDGEKSTWSPISKITLPQGDEMPGGFFLHDQTINNMIGIGINTGTNEVTAVEVAAREGNYGSWVSVAKIEKYDTDGNVEISSNTTYNYVFYNNQLKLSLDQLDTNKPFDYLPHVAVEQEVIENNRLIYANYKEGYDNLKTDVELQFQVEKLDMSHVGNEAEWSYDLAMHYKSNYGKWLKFKFKGCKVLDFLTVEPNTVLLFTCKVTKIEYSSPKHYIPVDEKYISAIHVIREGETLDDVLNTLCDKVNDQTFEIDNGDGTDAETVLYNYPFQNGATYISGTYQDDFLYARIGLYELNTVETTYFNQINEYHLYIFTSNAVTYKTFKSGSWVEFALAYYDRANRCCAAQVSDRSKIYLPYLTELVENGIITDKQMFHKLLINWKINHQPPEWATHYGWLIGKPLPYFLDFAVPYYDVGYTNNNEIFVMLNDSILTMHRYLTKSSISPYTWQKGDRMRFYGVRNEYGDILYLEKFTDVEIIGIDYLSDENNDFGYTVDGSYGDDRFVRDEKGNKIRDPYKQKLILEYFDITETGGVSPNVDSSNQLVPGRFQPQHGGVDKFWLVEVYRPSVVIDEEVKLFYEQGEIYEIGNPHTSGRYHKGGYRGQDQVPNQLPATGQFAEGNAYAKFRITGIIGFPCESQWFSDWFESSYTSLGRINAVDRDMRRRLLSTNIRYGGLYIQNTHINNLSCFDPSDFESLKNKFGAIYRIREHGYVLKIMQKYKISSVYLGRAGLRLAEAQESNGLELLSASDSVLGTRYESVENYGTVHPFSVCNTPSFEYFVDVNNSVIIKAGNNGMIPISKVCEVENDVKELCELFRNENDDSWIVSGYNSDYDEVYFTFYVLKDGIITCKTFVYNEANNIFHSFINLDKSGVPPEMYGNLGNKFVSWLNGRLYLHNQPLFNHFYGEFKDASIKLIFNLEPFKDKIFKDIIIDAVGQWEAPETGDIVVIDEAGKQAVSRIKFEKFVRKHGVYYGSFGKNMMTNNSEATVYDLINGSDLRGTYLIITLKERNDGYYAALRAVIVESITSELSG